MMLLVAVMLMMMMMLVAVMMMMMTRMMTTTTTMTKKTKHDLVTAVAVGDDVRPIIFPSLLRTDATDESNPELTTRVPNDLVVVVVVAVEVSSCYPTTPHSCGRRRNTTNPGKTTTRTRKG